VTRTDTRAELLHAMREKDSSSIGLQWGGSRASACQPDVTFDSLLQKAQTATGAERSRIISQEITASIANVTPPGLGLRPEAWPRVARPTLSLEVALDELEHARGPLEERRAMGRVLVRAQQLRSAWQRAAADLRPFTSKEVLR
jgi:hypothetical protein